MLRNAASFSSVNFTSMLLAFLGKGLIVCICVIITHNMAGSYGVSSAIPFDVIVGIIAFIIATLFLSLFEFSALTILQCFLVDSETGGSRKTPNSLQGFLDRVQDEQAKNKQVVPDVD